MLQQSPASRIVFLDYLRVFACLMVMIIHACEFYYIGDSGVEIKPGDGFWVSSIDSAMRASVPLFVMTSSYLLLPLKDAPGKFYKKRFIRVLIPFIIWSLLYATLPALWGAFTKQQVGSNLLQLLFNFNDNSGHLWFVYMLIGLYLFMPLLSPWLKQTSKRFEGAILLLCFFTTFYHYLRFLAPAGLWGEAFWNEFNAIWYFSGYIGYIILAHYMREYIHWSVTRSWMVGLVLFLIGYGVTAGVFNHFMGTTKDLVLQETSWRFCTPNVFLMSTGIFLIFKTFRFRPAFFYSLVQDISKLSYAMYLMHIFYLNLMYYLIHAYFSTPVSILLMAPATFILSYVTAKILSYLPKSKFIVG